MALLVGTVGLQLWSSPANFWGVYLSVARVFIEAVKWELLRRRGEEKEGIEVDALRTSLVRAFKFAVRTKS